MKPQELISKYIQNTLTTDELKEFNRLLDSDPGFSEEVNFHVNLQKVAEDKDDYNFKALLLDLEQNAPSKRKKSIKKWWLVAASVITILGLVYYSNSEKAVSNDILFATYFEPYRNITQPVVRGNAQEDLKTIAFNAYENGDYNKALEIFDQLLLIKEDPSIQFYKSNILLKLDNAEMAIPILEKNSLVLDSFSEKRYWYLALGYLKINMPEKSKEKLRLLLNVPNSEYKKEEAKELLKKMN